MGPVAGPLVTDLRQGTKALKRFGPRSSWVDGDGGRMGMVEARMACRRVTVTGARERERAMQVNGPRSCCRHSIEEIQGPRKQVSM